MTANNNMSGVAPGAGKPSVRKLACKQSNAYGREDRVVRLQTLTCGYQGEMKESEAKRLGLIR